MTIYYPRVSVLKSIGSGVLLSLMTGQAMLACDYQMSYIRHGHELVASLDFPHSDL